MLELFLELGLHRDSKFGIDWLMGMFGLVVGLKRHRLPRACIRVIQRKSGI